MDQLTEWLFRLLIGILAFMGIRIWNRQDKHEERMNTMAMNCVTRNDLRETMKEWREDRQAMHKENKDALTDIKESVNDIRDTVGEVAVKVATLSRVP